MTQVQKMSYKNQFKIALQGIKAQKLTKNAFYLILRDRDNLWFSCGLRTTLSIKLLVKKNYLLIDSGQELSKTIHMFCSVGLILSLDCIIVSYEKTRQYKYIKKLVCWTRTLEKQWDTGKKQDN